MQTHSISEKPRRSPWQLNWARCCLSTRSMVVPPRRPAGIPFVGVLGVLARAKREHLIDEVRPLIDRLRTELRFRIAEKLYKEFLEANGASFRARTLRQSSALCSFANSRAAVVRRIDSLFSLPWMRCSSATTSHLVTDLHSELGNATTDFIREIAQNSLTGLDRFFRYVWIYLLFQPFDGMFVPCWLLSSAFLSVPSHSMT